MRSSKSRSRNKNNRNRSGGNNLNRVFDSSGPEGKVRGTPQQIIEKYAQLAQDALLSNDRVATENFQQHGEHYTRLQAKAQREIEAKRELQEQQQRDRQQNRNEQNQGPQNRGDQNRQHQPNDNNNAPTPAQNRAPENVAPPADLAAAEQPDVIPAPPAQDTGPVETPETAPAKKTRTPRKRKPAKVENADKKPEAPEAAE